MDKDREQEIKFFESELDICHAFLDIAGPKQLINLIAKARLGYENVLLWIGTMHDSSQLARINAKLDRLRERLSSCSPPAPSQTAAASVNRGS
jgi:hypothetical protein